VRALGILLIVAAVVVVIAVVLITMSHVVPRVRDRRRRQSDREVRWTPYCRPVPPVAPTYLEIGVERVTEDGRTLSHVQMASVDLHDEVERLVAENDAKLRAEQYNDAKVGM
jgi:hypothetical protein